MNSVAISKVNLSDPGGCSFRNEWWFLSFSHSELGKTHTWKGGGKQVGWDDTVRQSNHHVPVWMRFLVWLSPHCIFFFLHLTKFCWTSATGFSVWHDVNHLTCTLYHFKRTNNSASLSPPSVFWMCFGKQRHYVLWSYCCSASNWNIKMTWNIWRTLSWLFNVSICFHIFTCFHVALSKITDEKELTGLGKTEVHKEK